MMRKLEDLTGRTFEKLKVVCLDESNQTGKAKWICQCECGTVVSVFARNLKGGHSKSCGCARAGNAKKRAEREASPGICYNVWCPHRNNYEGVWSCTRCAYCPGRHTKRKTDPQTLDIII